MSKIFRPQVDNWQGLLELVRAGEEWHTANNSFSGVQNNADSARLPRQGWMSDANYNSLERHHKMHGIDFLVRSYRTVIAYRLSNGEWHIPSDRHSRTTSNHQRLIETVVYVIGDQAA